MQQISRRMPQSFFSVPGWQYSQDLRTGARIIESNNETGITGRRNVVRRRIWTGAALMLALLAVSACGMEPYEPRNNREEGPKSGLLTGEEGEFVIFRLRSKPKGEEGSEEIETQEEESETQDSQ